MDAAHDGGWHRVPCLSLDSRTPCGREHPPCGSDLPTEGLRNACLASPRVREPEPPWPSSMPVTISMC